MRQKIVMPVALIVVGLLVGAAAVAQNAAPPSLKEQLEAQYSLSKVQTDGTVLSAGTVLVVQKAGIQAFPPGNAIVAPNTYQDGVLHPAGGKSRTITSFTDALVRNQSSVSGSQARPLHVGEKVYVTDIDVKSKKKDTIALTIVECDTCNGVTQISSYKALVDFEFAKGYLATASVPDVEDTIAKVFAIDTGAAQAQPAQPTAQPEQPAAAQPAPAQAAPAQIQLGQTIDEVVAALGQPEKTVDLGSKKIYVYKDLKVTFVNGKVSDVQ